MGSRCGLCTARAFQSAARSPPPCRAPTASQPTLTGGGGCTAPPAVSSCPADPASAQSSVGWLPEAVPEQWPWPESRHCGWSDAATLSPLDPTDTCDSDSCCRQRCGLEWPLATGSSWPCLAAGVYSPGCGLASVAMSWTAAEFLHLLLSLNGSCLPPAALFLVRYQQVCLTRLRLSTLRPVCLSTSICWQARTAAA